MYVILLLFFFNLKSPSTKTSLGRWTVWYTWGPNPAQPIISLWYGELLKFLGLGFCTSVQWNYYHPHHKTSLKFQWEYIWKCLAHAVLKKCHTSSHTPWMAYFNKYPSFSSFTHLGMGRRKKKKKKRVYNESLRGYFKLRKEML